MVKLHFSDFGRTEPEPHELFSLTTEQTSGFQELTDRQGLQGGVSYSGGDSLTPQRGLEVADIPGSISVRPHPSRNGWDDWFL